MRWPSVLGKCCGHRRAAQCALAFAARCGATDLGGLCYSSTTPLGGLSIVGLQQCANLTAVQVRVRHLTLAPHRTWGAPIKVLECVKLESHYESGQPLCLRSFFTYFSAKQQVAPVRASQLPLALDRRDPGVNKARKSRQEVTVGPCSNLSCSRISPGLPRWGMIEGARRMLVSRTG